MKVYQSRLNPDILVRWRSAGTKSIGRQRIVMYYFVFSDGSIGGMDERSFHEFYKQVDAQ